MKEYRITTKEFWNNEILKANLIWPNENVIRFVKRNVKDTNKVILDFGCGAGRNAIALAQEGYNVIAMDYSKQAIELAVQKAKANNIDIDFRINSDTIPLQPGSVDVIVANGSLFYSSVTETIEMLRKLKNIMSEDGIFWADWRTKEDSLYGMGKEIEPNFFEMNKESGREGCSYHFFDEKQLREIYKETELEIISFDKFEYTENNGKKKSSWFHIVSRKMGRK